MQEIYSNARHVVVTQKVFVQCVCCYRPVIWREDHILLRQADLSLKSHFIALVELFNFFVQHEFPNMKSKVVIIATSELQRLNNVKQVEVLCRGGQQHLSAPSLFSSDSHRPSLQLCELSTMQRRLFSKKKIQPFWGPHCPFPCNTETSSAAFRPALCDSAEFLHVRRPVTEIVSLWSCTACSWHCRPQGSARWPLTNAWIPAHCACSGAGVCKTETQRRFRQC